ncbi:MAG: acetoacetate--CoA ligase [Saprospiraceae bacterium]
MTKPLYTPTISAIQNSHLYRYMRWLEDERLFVFSETDEALRYAELQRWSATSIEDFWQSLWRYFEIMHDGAYERVLQGERMPFYRWFEGTRLNYAEHIFRMADPLRPALIFKSEMQDAEEVSWARLRGEVAALAAFFREKGVGVGDRVAAFLPNTPHAVAAALAAISIGAIWSSCSPDFGVNSVAERFGQIEPKVLIAADGYMYGGKRFDRRDTVRALCAQLPTVQTVVWIPYLDAGSKPDGIPGGVLWADALAGRSDELRFERAPFSHPIWVLYSSGTTGAPKAITHSHGGNLLEHLKYLHFHNDVHCGERFFWYSTTGWMMWNFAVGALLCGATVVLYDGSPGWPDMETLWRLAEQTRITHFGTGAPFVVGCMKAGLRPGAHLDLSGMRSLGSTGSPLPPEGFEWIYSALKPDLWLASMSGGTDVCTAWVGGNPLLPVWAGEIQCRCLGCAMESWDESGRPVQAGQVGEMVVTRPMPSMPVFMWNDPDYEKYLSSYFEYYPGGVWRHGDWLLITERDTLVILGRSDATLNRQGVRIGTAEIYRAIDQIEEVRDSLIVNIEYPDGTDWMPMFVAVNPGYRLDDALRLKIKTALRAAYSPRHVPDEIIEAPDIPYTISGKKMETPVKKLLRGEAASKAYSADAMKNPEAMDFFASFVKGLCN